MTKNTGVMRMFVFEDDAGKWRWRIKSPNGRTTATSGEAFASKGNAQKAADRMIDMVLDADVVTFEGEDRR